MKPTYQVAVIGAVAPYATFYGYLAYLPGCAAALSLTSGNSIVAGASMDLTISSLIFWRFPFRGSRQSGKRCAWRLVPGNGVVGWLFALPAFRCLRACRLATR